jgi:hypothetical protein
LIIKLDDNKYPIYETAKRTPLQATGTKSVAASTTDRATITIPDNEVWFIKKWTVTKGADVTVSSIKIDNNDTYQAASVTDTEAQYGAVLNAGTDIVISGSNAGIAAETLEIKVEGYKIVF